MCHSQCRPRRKRAPVCAGGLMGRSQREKGKRGERAAAKAISEHLGVSARRGVQYQGGADSQDIVVRLDGVHWEVKFVERESVRAWVEQADKDSGGLIPVVLHRRSRKPWLVTVPLERLHEFAAKLAQAVAGEVQALGPQGVSGSVSVPVVPASSKQTAGHAGLFSARRRRKQRDHRNC